MEIAICAIARFENPYICEWIEWHLSIGFTRIYLYDNNREGEERLADAVKQLPCAMQALVEIIPFHGQQDYPQIKAYHDCWNTKDFDWVAFFDVDEFFTFSECSRFTNVIDFIKSLDAFDAILLNWKMYGDSGHLHYEPLPVRQRFDKPLPLFFTPFNLWGKNPINGHVKTLVRKDCSFRVSGPHVGEGGYRCCNADGEEIPNQPYSPAFTHKTAYIAHYITKTIEEYIASKAQRPAADGNFYHNYPLRNFFYFNRPTVAKLKMYKAAVAKYPQPVTLSLMWWVKLWLKMWIITPIVSYVRKE